MFATKHLPEVLYPAINLKVFEKSASFNNDISQLLGREVNSSTRILTSLNRYERKKNIPLALKAFADYLSRTSSAKSNTFLVVAGGWDPRVVENVEHEQELIKVAEELKITDKVIFLKSISNDQRLLLLEKTNVLLYTPENEHFGIVPVEAMYMGCIVMACNSGGPLESVDNGNTGYLQKPDEKLWGGQIHELLEQKTQQQIQQLKENAKKRVHNMFIMDVFADSLDRMVSSMKA